jgi:SAM-dependent methyltransferase
MCPTFEEAVTPIQKLCESRPMIAIYDHIWRPFGYFFTSSRSFSEDLERITALIEPERRDRILDLGCGPGNFTRLIAKQGPGAQVVGFDLAERMLARAAHLSSGPQFDNASYLRGNALEMPFESNTFDAVICCAALHLFSDYDQALSEVSRVLAVGGEFVCQTIVTPPSTPIWLRFADRVFRFGYFERDELKAQLEALDLEIVGEESSKVSYIFRARKRRESRPLAAGAAQ